MARRDESDEEEYEERPRRRPSREESAQPAKPRRPAREVEEDEEEERPRRRRPREEEDEDEEERRPAKRRRPRDDEDDYDDDDDRPRKKKKKKGTTDEERQMAMFCHLGMLLGGFIIPLIIWMMKKDESRYIERHGREALNFAISLFIYYAVTCGCAAIILGPFTIYWCIMAGMEANKGRMYHYPMCIHFM